MRVLSVCGTIVSVLDRICSLAHNWSQAIDRIYATTITTTPQAATATSSIGTKRLKRFTRTQFANRCVVIMPICPARAAGARLHNYTTFEYVYSRLRYIDTQTPHTHTLNDLSGHTHVRHVCEA